MLQKKILDMGDQPNNQTPSRQTKLGKTIHEFSVLIAMSFLVIIGDGAVGKTSFLMRFCKNEFPEDYIPTGTVTGSKNYL